MSEFLISVQSIQLGAPEGRKPAVRPQLEHSLTAPPDFLRALESQNLKRTDDRKEVTFSGDRSVRPKHRGRRASDRLTPPPSDYRPEVYYLGNPEAMVELRKMNREILKRAKKVSIQM